MDEGDTVLCVACGAATATLPACEGCGGVPSLSGRYWLESVIGQGSFGVVYAGRDVAEGADVAIKEIVVGHGERARVRADAEASALEAELHPGLPRLIERIDLESDGVPMRYLVLERFVGPDLATALKERRFSVEETFERLAETFSVLAALHSRGLVHRDVKTNNLIVRPDGGLALVDLGSVAAFAQPSGAHLTATGTVGYMPPEQLAGVTRVENDVYAVGALGVAMLTRQEPVDLLDAEHRLDWRDRVQLHPRQRDWLVSLLALSADERPDDAAELAREARALASLDPVTHGRARHRGMTAMVVLLLALFGTVTAVALLWPEPPAAASAPTPGATEPPPPVTDPVEPAPVPPPPQGRMAVPPAEPTACERAGNCRSAAEFEGLSLRTREPVAPGVRVVEHTERFEAEIAGVEVPCTRTTLPMMVNVTCFHGPRGHRTGTRYSSYLAYLRETYGRETPGAFSVRETGHRWRGGRHTLELSVSRPPGCNEDACVEDLRTYWRGPPE